MKLVNTVDLERSDILAALETEAGCRFEPLRPYKPVVPRPGCYCATIEGELVIVDLFYGDGFSEIDYDRALGAGSAQRVIDGLRSIRQQKAG